MRLFLILLTKSFFIFCALQVAHALAKVVKRSKARVLDLCCGVGTSTRAIADAFPEAEAIIGVDTSAEMISMAQFLSLHLSVVRPLAKIFQKYKTSEILSSVVESLQTQTAFLSLTAKPHRGTTYTCGNAESTPFPGQSFDLVTIMYGFHEAPKEGRDRILREAHRLLEPGGTLAVIDICSEFKPLPSMLMGEPYGE
jgi:ubiquinone/menaquinone biosynthesis C-methylase UbiE